MTSLTDMRISTRQFINVLRLHTQTYYEDFTLLIVKRES